MILNNNITSSDLYETTGASEIIEGADNLFTTLIAPFINPIIIRPLIKRKPLLMAIINAPLLYVIVKKIYNTNYTNFQDFTKGTKLGRIVIISSLEFFMWPLLSVLIWHGVELAGYDGPEGMGLVVLTLLAQGLINIIINQINNAFSIIARVNSFLYSIILTVQCITIILVDLPIVILAIIYITEIIDSELTDICLELFFYSYRDIFLILNHFLPIEEIICDIFVRLVST